MRLTLFIVIILLLSACVYKGDKIYPLLEGDVLSTSEVGPCSPSIGFTFVPAYGSYEDLQGQVRCVDPEKYKIAVYIYISGWWIKPTFQDPLTSITTGGNWIADTTTGGLDHQATQITVFLVPDGYNPPLMSGERVLPQDLFEKAVAYGSVRRKPIVREIEFSGYTWKVKESESFAVGPGPNYFSDNEDNVWVDEKGQLHLTITTIENRWYATEVIASESFGYGIYTFTLASRIDLLDENVVLGLFTWDDSAPEHNYREIDIEFARWGERTGENAQYVVQPWDYPANRYRFDMELQGENSVHSFEWQPDRIRFSSVQSSGDTIESWLYTDASIPPPGNENPRINLWLFGSAPPSDGKEVEVVIEAFEFSPSELSTVLPSPTPLPTFSGTSDQLSSSPWITVTAADGKAWGEVGPPSVCNAEYKVALYAKTDIWYVQPFADSRRNIKINDDCTWSSSTHSWEQVAAHLVKAGYDHPAMVLLSLSCPPPPLDPEIYSDVLATACFP